MKCSAVTETQGLLYLYGELSPAQQASLEAHLAACAGCRAQIADLRQTRSMVKHLDCPPPPEYALERIRQAARRKVTRRVSWWERFKSAVSLPMLPLPRWAVPALTAASVALVAGLYLAPRPMNTAALAAIENDLDAQVMALADEIEVLEWEWYESNDMTRLDQASAELDELVETIL